MVREYGFNPRSKVSVEDGAVLPRKFEPFPADMYGKPLEEIDNFIYEEVSGSLIIYPITYTYLVPHHKYYTERPLNVSLRRRTDFSPLYWPRTRVRALFDMIIQASRAPKVSSIFIS